MTGLLEAALDWAAAEMDLRPPNACMPPPLALLRGELIDPGIRATWDDEEAEEAPRPT